jgi:hypothetical protein
MGISTGSYSHSHAYPVFGTGQGSCASPPYWLLNCSKYFVLYDKSCFGATYIDMSGKKKTKLGMGGFVDDNCCNVNGFPNEEHMLVDWATHDAQLWGVRTFQVFLSLPSDSVHTHWTTLLSRGAIWQTDHYFGSQRKGNDIIPPLGLQAIQDTWNVSGSNTLRMHTIRNTPGRRRPR